MSHTAGPWINRAYIIETVSGRKIATVNAEHVHYGEPARSKIEREDDSNGSLLSSAPKLLAACKAALEFAAEADEDLGMNHWPMLQEAIEEAERTV